MRKAQLRKESLRFIRQALIACREQQFYLIDASYGRCLGSIAMAKRLDAITDDELDRLLDLAINAVFMADRDRRAKEGLRHAA